MEAKEGELSLGIGRKKGEEDEDELAETIERSITEETRESRTESTMTTGRKLRNLYLHLDVALRSYRLIFHLLHRLFW